MTERWAACCLMPVLMMVCAPAAAWPEVPLPEDSQGELVSRHMSHNGIEMRASRFTTLRDLEQVKGFYRGTWGEQLVENELEGKTIIGRAEDGYFVTVELDDRRGLVEGTIGIMKLEAERGRERTFEPGAGFDKPADTSVFNDIRYFDVPGQARTLGMENGLSPYVNRQFYVHRLRMRGWSLSGVDSCSAHASACFARFEKANGDRISMAMTRRGDVRTQIVVNIE